MPGCLAFVCVLLPVFASASIQDPEIVDRQVDLVDDFAEGSPVDVEAAWFVDEGTVVHVALRAADVPATGAYTGAAVEYVVEFSPAYAVPDPSWGGRLAPGASLRTLQVQAVVRSPARAEGVEPLPQPEFRLRAEYAVAGGAVLLTPLSWIQGSADPATDTVHWFVPKSALQGPADGDGLVRTSARASGMVLGGLLSSTFLEDGTGPGRAFVVGPS